MVKKKNIGPKKKFNAKRDRGIISKILFVLYKSKFKFIRNFILKVFYSYVGAHCEYYSLSLRKLFYTFHKVEIGMYSSGACFIPSLFPEGTKIGRYCTIDKTVRILNVNHPMNLKSSHAVFFNPVLGYSDSNLANFTQVTIGNDVRIGAHVIILPACSTIGDGVVITPGTLVSKNIPPFAVVAGHLTKITGFRFSKEKIKQIKESEWWDKNIEELLPDMKNFLIPQEDQSKT
jgi:acetyltransferase-like isoleucine patch superfamily enzyme